MRVFVTVRSIWCPPAWIQKKRVKKVVVSQLQQSRDFESTYLPTCSWAAAAAAAAAAEAADADPEEGPCEGSKTADPGRTIIIPRAPDSLWCVRSLTSRLLTWLIWTWPRIHQWSKINNQNSKRFELLKHQMEINGVQKLNLPPFFRYFLSCDFWIFPPFLRWNIIASFKFCLNFPPFLKRKDGVFIKHDLLFEILNFPPKMTGGKFKSWGYKSCLPKISSFRKRKGGKFKLF